MDLLAVTLQNRLQMLRNTYSLPVLDAEWVCRVSRSSINFWERGVRIPSADGIRQIASAYGVSTDWVFGISDTAYTPNSVEFAENYHQIRNTLLRCILSKIYSDATVTNELINRYENEVMSNKFPLQSRADIIVCCLYLQGYDNYFNSKPGVEPTIQQKKRMLWFKEMLLKVLQTKKPISNLQ